jgi:DNA ligase 1
MMNFIFPMLLTPSDPFSEEGWIFEWKADGIRMELIHQKTKGITAYTRHKTNCSRAFPELQTLSFNDDVILDGELICYDPELKRDSWELVMERFHLSQDIKINYAAETIPCTYVVFDVLYLNRPTMKLPLIERKSILDDLIENTPFIQKSSYLETEGEGFFEQIKLLQLEGAVAKKKNSPYWPAKRVDFWKKIVRYEYFDVMLTGFRKGNFGLLSSFITEKGLKPAGMIEFASPALRKEFFRRAYSLKKGEDSLNIYLTEGILGRVKTRGLTKNGYLRTPVLTEIF